MNTPAAGNGNWTWRYGFHALHQDFAVKLAELMEMTDRDGFVLPEPDPIEIVNATTEHGQNI